MDKAYFPMFIDISEKKILVVGGGTIACRRVQTLLKFAEDIQVVAPALCEELVSLEQKGKIKCIQREYWVDDLVGKEMVLAATDCQKVNREIAEQCKEKQVLVNVADNRSLCDFYFPAVAKTDEIVVGINSGGENPGKVKAVRKQIEELLES